MFDLFKKKKTFFTEAEKKQIAEAIGSCEQCTSGEIRVFVENRCSYMDAIDRAVELFFRLGMDKTSQRNGVLVYIAMKDHQLAVYGDVGIHQKVGTEYWNNVVAEMIRDFNRDNYAEGISHCVEKIGKTLQKNFPYDRNTDKNELSNDITFGN